MNSKWTIPLIQKKVMSITFICDFNMRVFLGCGDGCFHWKFCHFLLRSHWKHHVLSPMIFFEEKLFVNYRKIGTHINAQRHRNTHLISATTSTQLVLICWNYIWFKVKHGWLPLSYAIKSFRELHSRMSQSILCKLLHIPIVLIKLIQYETHNSELVGPSKWLIILCGIRSTWVCVCVCVCVCSVHTYKYTHTLSYVCVHAHVHIKGQKHQSCNWIFNYVLWNFLPSCVYFILTYEVSRHACVTYYFVDRGSSRKIWT
jgi:hypothetical protein